ncbi:unnamed protein product [Brachionus calyciflorus]|uniref:Uncharacterized protein n=1 Tax=Brachionus calyciflorus TaxID=104777 RepID=A0A814G7Y8_9BILA|nr:unnamed protein product [Brachionus calyciflorus]
MKSLLLFVAIFSLATYWNDIFAMSYTKMFGFYEISPTQIGNYVSVQSTILLGSINGKSKLECFKTCSLNLDCLLIQFDNYKNCAFYKSIQSSDQSNSCTYFYRKIQNKGIILEYTSQVVQNSNQSRYLYLENNKIQAINYKAFEPLSKLRELDLYRNLLDYLNPNVFNGLLNLYYLVLESNRLRSIEKGLFKDLKNLRNLYLNYNFLDKITSEFSSLTNLIYLYLGFNQISVIEEGSFRNMSKLIRLNLNNNKLKCINISTFEGLDSLTYLDLSNNLLISIDSNAFKFSINLGQLYIQSNALNYLNESIFFGLNKLLGVSMDRSLFDSKNFSAIYPNTTFTLI